MEQDLVTSRTWPENSPSGGCGRGPTALRLLRGAPSPGPKIALRLTGGARVPEAGSRGKETPPRAKVGVGPTEPEEQEGQAPRPLELQGSSEPLGLTFQRGLEGPVLSLSLQG